MHPILNKKKKKILQKLDHVIAAAPPYLQASYGECVRVKEDPLRGAVQDPEGGMAAGRHTSLTL